MRYLTQAEHYRHLFGTRVQKLSVDAGFSCPNREAMHREAGGCTFCRNEAFNPSYCRRTPSITEQLREGIAFHRHRYRRSQAYLAYFQAYSNTYASIGVLRERYEEALRCEGVVGLVIGTRPDCVDEEVLNLLCELSQRCYIAVEYGIESCYDRTLTAIHRGHDFACTCRAIRATAGRGVPVGGHLILGLPGESREDMLDEVEWLNALPLTSIKLHQLQILQGTPMQESYRLSEEFRRSVIDWTVSDYVGTVCDILERLRPDMVVERLAGEVPPRYQAFPERSFRRSDGGYLRNEEVPALVEAELERRGTWQGAQYVQPKMC